jgi:predicted nucleic acid-binding protein
MDRWVYWDASALAKRYTVEPGTTLVNGLFRRVSRDRMACLIMSVLEVISILVRKNNALVLSATGYQQAMAEFDKEVVHAADFTKDSITDTLVYASSPFIEKHSINATDALVLRSALDFAVNLRKAGDDLVLVASDQRLLRAAQAEGLDIFNPETQPQSDLDLLLVP